MEPSNLPTIGSLFSRATHLVEAHGKDWREEECRAFVADTRSFGKVQVARDFEDGRLVIEANAGGGPEWIAFDKSGNADTRSPRVLCEVHKLLGEIEESVSNIRTGQQSNPPDLQATGGGDNLKT